MKRLIKYLLPVIVALFLVFFSSNQLLKTNFQKCQKLVHKVIQSQMEQNDVESNKI